MKYMLLIYGAESSWTEEERRECMIESMRICDELEVQGKWIDSAPLHSVATATCVRVRDGQRQVTDGPFAETSEQLGGYYIIDVGDLEEAVAIASRLPPATRNNRNFRDPRKSISGSRNLSASGRRHLWDRLGRISGRWSAAAPLSPE